MFPAIIGFLNYIYQKLVVFRPRPAAPAHENPTSISTFNFEDLVPVYDAENGRVIGFVSASRAKSYVSSSSVPPSLQSLPPRLLPSDRLSTQQANQSQRPLPLQQRTSVDWDYWPDGTFDRDFTWEEVSATSRLMCHWAVLVGGGDRKGNSHAANWESGKKATRSCLGVILCDNPDCQIAVRPHTKSQSLAKQLATSCDCGAQRFQQKCSVRSILWTWSEGIHFRNEGFHSHDRPPRLLHLSNDEKDKFRALVNQYPKTGPLGLIVGVPGIDGPGQSVADISDALLNADRVSKERLKIKNIPGGKGGNADSFVTSFSQFDDEHPNFVRLSVLGKVSVISMQTPFMASQLIHGDIDDSPINGLVNDAAHGWWQSKNCLLMITSIYCLVLHCWVPVLFSYTNGASTTHFKHHFLTLFQSIAMQAESQMIAVTDRLFAGVMDFSEAERNGFIEAFVTFWSNRGDDTRSKADLREDASCLLRGCQEHFRAGVTRLSRISGVIPVEKRHAFVQRAVALLSVPTEDEFSLRAKLILRDFPKTASWLNWWIRPAHASMLFEAHRKMDIAIWEAIPVTTNAEEAMHWKLYAAAGRNHSFMEGLRSLYAVATYYERSFRENLRGVPIRYGQPERWKMVADQIGRTKPTRAPDAADRRRKKNDGRPPDTAKELLDPKKTEKQDKQVQQVVNVLNKQTKKAPAKSDINIASAIPSYPWQNNSCWLDTSLELLYTTVCYDFNEFSQACQQLRSDSPLHSLHHIFHIRQNLAQSTPNISTTLSKQRNYLRKRIVQAKEAKGLSTFEPLFSWFHGLLARESKSDVSYQFFSYFETLITEIHSCTGSTATGGHHLEILNIPLRFSEIQLKNHKAYSGNVTAWFADFISGQGTTFPDLACWRTREAEVLCSGVRTDTRGLVIAIPTMLMLAIPDSSNPLWNFPETLLPLTKTHAKRHGIIYDLVGFGLHSKDAGHFTARYALKNQDIFSYDGMKKNGHALWMDQALFSTHLAGNTQDFPKGYMVTTAVYHLRGGKKARDMFFNARRKEYSKHLNLDFSAQDPSLIPTCSYNGPEPLVELDPDVRFWIRPSLRNRSMEYISSVNVTVSNPTNQDPVSEVNSPESEEPTFNIGHLPSPAKSSLSLPDSLFTMNCRCGVQGDGNVLYREEEGTAVQCDECRDWSHIACQRNGRASLLGNKDKFICDFCDALTVLHPQFHEKQRESARKILGSRLQLKKPLHERLRAGRGGLARSGDFWYPVRLIQYQKKEKTWLVRWWRECSFDAPQSLAPGSITTVSELDIVDSLWGDRMGRRKVRLGKWVHAHDIPTAEDILSDPSSVPYTPEMHEALSPSIELLQAILNDPENVEDIQIPAKTWLESQGKNVKTAIVPFTGNLSVIERAQLGNWFEVHVAKNKNRRRFWLSLLPFAHTCTLWLVALLQKNRGQLQKFDASDDDQVLEAAWQLQTTHTPEMVWKDRFDVDKECLELLEEEMFERSSLAGIAGNYQWGLNAGEHQGGWNPYAGTPEEWNHNDRDSSGEDEHEHGPNYITVHKPTPELRPQPRPRPKGKAGKRVHK